MMKQRFLFLFRALIALLVVFGVMKVVFMLYNAEESGFGVADIGAVLLHGFPLDLSTSLYLLILPWAVCVASIWIKGRWPERVLIVYGWVIAVLLALILVGDCALYEYWQFKLDATIFNYITSPSSIVASVSGLFLFVGILAVALLTAVIGLTLQHMAKGAFSRCRRRRRAAIALILLAPLMFLGIRGGVGRGTMNVGNVYYSENQFLNHSAVNPAFSLLASSSKVMDFHDLYRFMPTQEADSLYQSLHFSTAETRPAPLLRTERPNIVLFILEGFGANFIDSLRTTSHSGNALADFRAATYPQGFASPQGLISDITPNFNALCREGVLFTRCFATSFRTDRGIISSLSGYPAFPDFSIMKIPEKSRSLPSIASALRSVGYSTAYLYGGDINFTNQKSYLLSTGFQKAEGDLVFPIGVRRTHSWGVADHILFDTLYNRIAHMAPAKRSHTANGGDIADAQPFFITCQTLSSHEDWRVPYSRYPKDEKANAIAYVDHYLGRLISRLKKTPAWDNLLLVFVADHGIAYPNGLTEATVSRCHIPLLFAGGAIKKHVRVDAVCSQSDLPATLLGLLGLPHNAFRFSRDVLSPTYTYPCAIHTFGNGFTFIDSTGATVYDLRSKRVISTIGNPSLTSRRQRLGEALLQTQICDFDRK